MPVQDPIFEDMANDAVDFREMIAKPIGEWEANPLLPTGHLFGQCVDVLTGKSRNKGTRFFAFICQPQEFGPDIPADTQKSLTAAGLSLTDYEFPKRERVGTGLPAGQIWITPGSMNMNREFFTRMGFPESKPQDECIVEMRGRKVLMAIGKEPFENAQGQTREFNVMTDLFQDPR